MKIDHNLDLTEGKTIESQLKDFAVAANRWDPKPEDFAYKYSECDEWQKGVLLGMAICIDMVSEYCDVEDMVYQMCDHLISFAETNYEGEE